MKLKFLVLVIGLSSFIQASTTRVSAKPAVRTAWGAGGKAQIPSLSEMHRSKGTVRTLAPKKPLAGSRDGSAIRVSGEVSSVSSPKNASEIPSSLSTVALPSTDISSASLSTPPSTGSLLASSDDRSQGSSSPSPTRVYREDDMNDVVRHAIKLQREQTEELRKKTEQEQLEKNRIRLKAEQSAQLAREREAALQERDMHVRAENIGLKYENDQLAIRRQARDFVNFLDTVSSANQRNNMKQDYLRTLFENKSLPDYRAMRDQIDQLEHRSQMLRDHAQKFQEYLDTLPDASARTIATQKQLQSMNDYDRADVDKFIMFLGQMEPVSLSKFSPSVEQQPTESEIFEQEMSADAQSIQEESKQHEELLARQKKSIQSWNAKLEKYKAMLGSADGEKKLRIESLIKRTEQEFVEMKKAFSEAIEKSSKKLEQHMQDHTNAIIEFSHKQKETDMAEATQVAQVKHEQDQAAALARDTQEREERLRVQEQAIREQQDALQKEREEHARVVKEKQDELARQAQELADKQNEMNRSSSQSSSDLSGSITRRPGMLAHSLIPTHIYYPTYRLPEPAVKDDAAQKRTWKEMFKSGATALASGVQKAKETLSKFATSLPQGGTDSDDRSSWQSDSSDDSSSDRDDERQEVVASQHHEEVSHAQEEQVEKEEHEPTVDFTGENFSNIG